MRNYNHRRLAFFQEFFQGGGGKIYCYANFFCYANLSIVFGPNFGGGKLSERGKLPQGPPVTESQVGPPIKFGLRKGDCFVKKF